MIVSMDHGVEGGRVRLAREFMGEPLHRLVEERLQEVRARPAPYGHSTYEGNRVGVLGEAAVAVWLDRHGFVGVSSEDKQRSDLIVGRDGQPPWVRIEVKTWSERWWSRFGRSVSATQLRRIVSRDWLVAWVIDHGTAPDGGGLVELHSWTPTVDLQTHGVPEWIGGPRAAVRVHGDSLRPVSELAALDPMAFRLFAPTSAPGCGHPHLLGKCWQCAEVPDGVWIPEQGTVAKGYVHLVDGPHHYPRSGAGTVSQVPYTEAVLEYPSCLKCFPATLN